MAVGKEIVTKIKSIKNTQKITKAMEMVSTSKMRKTQDRMRMARPYAEKIYSVIHHLAHSKIDDIGGFKALNKNINDNEVKAVGIVLITSDKGLCGGLNSNISKLFIMKLKELHQQNIKVKVVCLGSKGLALCRRLKLDVIASEIHLGDVPKMETLLGAIKVMIDQFMLHDIDKVYISYSKFITTMKQEPVYVPLLPLEDFDEKEHIHHKYNWDYIYEPGAKEVLNFLVRRYIESLVYQAVSDNMASEQAARMVAMKAATDNAINAIKELNIEYNKKRQGAITTEISEIVAGAAATL